MNDYSAIAGLYDAYVTDVRDLAFWSRRAAEAAGPILELTAGTGRATAALRAGSSQPVVALDLSLAMLRRLAAKLGVGAGRVWAVAGDLTALPIRAERFQLVVIPFNSFSEVVEPAQRLAAMQELRRVLTPTGRAVVTLHDPAHRRPTLDASVRRLGPFQAGDHRLDVLVSGRLLGGDVAESAQTYRLLDREGRVIEQRQLTVRFGLLDAASVLQMARQAGLAAAALYGDYDETPYVAGASPFILAVFGPATAAHAA